MRRFLRMFLPVLAILFLLGALPLGAKEWDRSKIPDSEKWDLSDLYPSDASWKEAKETLAGRLEGIARYKGKISGSAKALLSCLDLLFDLRKEFGRLRSYASMKADLDLRNAEAVGMEQSLGPLAADLQAQSAWVDPEILSIPREKIESFYKEEPGLEAYRPVIEDILRRKPHTLSPAEEKILADASLVEGGPHDVYSIFSNADIPRATITLSDGQKVRLDAAAYTLHRAAPQRFDREHVFQAFFGNLDAFRSTFGAMLNAEVRNHMFHARARHYESCLASALDDPNVPVSVYKNLVKNVNANLKTLHRYLELRKKIMKLPELRYSDLYASIVKKVDVRYTPEEAKTLVLSALAPLGEDYVAVLRSGYEHRWVDWYPTQGKRSGAYSNGSAYDVHPYMLLNFTGTYEEVSTLAHESGHSMHSYYSNKNQPYATCDYTIFVAEVASTCNENLLMDYMLKHTQDDAMKLFLLGSYIDNLRQTLFRQTQFAEFELKIHEMAEKGEALTGDVLNRVYGEILRKYYGEAEGICTIDPVCYAEWAYIPHFYYNFYVYTYATSLTASTAIARMILDGKEGAVKNYRTFLTLGDSMPPVDELKVAGVDMTTDAPFTITMKAMNEAMDQMEAILAESK